METLNVEVKSKDETLGTIDVQKFATLDEAVSFFVSKETEGDEATKKAAGYKSVLDLVNSQHRANVTNAERVRLTRGVSPLKALKDAVKAKPEVKQALEALLAQFGLPSKIE